MNCFEKLYNEIRTRFADTDEGAFEHMSEPLASIMKECKAKLESVPLKQPTDHEIWLIADEYTSKMSPRDAAVAAAIWMHDKWLTAELTAPEIEHSQRLQWTDLNIKQAVYYGCGYASGFQDQPRLPEEEREKAYAGFMKVVSALPSLLNEPHEP